MRIAFSVFLCFMSNCLAGCTVTPTPAHKLFGTSNPSATVQTPEGTFKIPTNMTARYKVNKRPDGVSVFDLTLKSDAAIVVDAEGNRIPGMLPGMEINHAWATQATAMNHQSMDKLVDKTFGLIETMAPLLIRPTPAPDGAESPPDQMALLKLELKRMFDAQAGEMMLRMQAMIDANKPREEP